MLFARHLPVAAGSLLLAVLASPLHAADAPPAPEVVVETVKAESLPLELEYSARTAGFREVQVRAQVSGILQLSAPSDFGRNVLLGWLDEFKLEHPNSRLFWLRAY